MIFKKKNTHFFFVCLFKEGRSQDSNLISIIDCDNKSSPLTPAMPVLLHYVRPGLLAGNYKLDVVHILCVCLFVCFTVEFSGLKMLAQNCQ